MTLPARLSLAGPSNLLRRDEFVENGARRLSYEDDDRALPRCDSTVGPLLYDDRWFPSLELAMSSRAPRPPSTFPVSGDTVVELLLGLSGDRGLSIDSRCAADVTSPFILQLGSST